MGWEKPDSLIMKWRKWALQISLLIDEFWNSSQAHSRSADYKPLTIALVENLSQLSCDMHDICLPALHALNLHLDCKEKYCRYCLTLLRFADAFTQPTMLTLLFPLQRVTATSMPVAVDSTWSCTSCRGGRAEGSAWTAATTLQAATATTARRAFTETWPGRSLTDEPAKVNKKVLLLSARLNSASLFLIVEILEMLYVLIAVCVFYTSLGNQAAFSVNKIFPGGFVFVSIHGGWPTPRTPMPSSSSAVRNIQHKSIFLGKNHQPLYVYNI